MYQLPSGEYSPQYASSRPGAPRLGVFLLVWAVLAFGYGAYRFMAPRKSSGASPADRTTSRPTDIKYALTLAGSRADAAIATTSRAQTELKDAETELRRTLSLTDSFVEARHLHAALAKLDAARQKLERARIDLDSLQLIVKGENKP